ncbi:LysE family translocator [Pseudescherichia sp.]|uniref:LysE family translocator n=1 Tax=Pseudescherichia sp. TaxID=2055881 RepID=UPI00289EB96E|nr:LysE family translocator [Pseudescherichia sp.]
MFYVYLPFMLFAFVASITPGPTNILVLSSSQRFGVKATLPAVVSGCAAASLIVLVSGAGAGEILRQYPLVRTGMSWAGVLWLSWMSWQLLRAPATELGGEALRPFSVRAAAMLQLINPKTWMMALAVVSLFAPNGAHPLREIAVMALLFLIISQLCLVVWAFCGRAVNRIFRTPASLIWFQRAMALCLLISAWAGLLL